MAALDQYVHLDGQMMTLGSFAGNLLLLLLTPKSTNITTTAATTTTTTKFGIWNFVFRHFFCHLLQLIIIIIMIIMIMIIL